MPKRSNAFNFVVSPHNDSEQACPAPQEFSPQNIGVPFNPTVEPCVSQLSWLTIPQQAGIWQSLGDRFPIGVGDFARGELDRGDMPQLGEGGDCLGSKLRAVDPQFLQIFDETTNAWKQVTGQYTFAVGGSSKELPLKQQVALK